MRAAVPTAGYAPSRGALLLARIFDGSPLSGGDSTVTDDELRHARNLLAVVHYAFAHGDAARRSRLAPAEAVLRGRPTKEPERRLQYADYVTQMVARLRPDEVDLATAEPAAQLIVFGLSTGFDSAFTALSPKRVYEALLSAVADPKSKGGAGNIAADHVAAELAVEVNAFGAARTGDFDKDVAAFKSQLRVDRNRAAEVKT